jgi:putative ATP-binding cassette transporter
MLVAQSARVREMFESLAATSQPPEGGAVTYKQKDGSESALLSASKFTLRLPPPSMRVICQGLDLRVSDGMRLLIVGPSGCGKSSLLRGLAGLWTRGNGSVECCEGSLFVPQKPYMTQGTLRQQLLFPRQTDTSASDDALLKVLGIVNLSDLSARCGGFDTVHQWQDFLSLGEQQRLAFARVLLLRPPIVCLDEATSALDAANEQSMYEALSERVLTWVSVGHREALLQHHTHVLHFASDDPTQWCLLTTSAYIRARTEPNSSSSHDSI